MQRATLILVPTQGEMTAILSERAWIHEPVRMEVCGFGPVAAAARTASLLAEERPKRVILAGIAGTYSPEAAPIGSAQEFGRVAIDGVGAGEEPVILGPRALGLPQWEPPGGDPAERIWDELPCGPIGPRELLVTVCAASGNAAHAEQRRRRWPDAVAEDMEGFGVALACHVARIPFRIVRGISNLAGDRDHSHWHVTPAVRSLQAWLDQNLGRQRG